MTENDAAAPLLEKSAPEVQALIQQLRALITEVLPKVSEKAHLGWGVIYYRSGGNMRDVVAALVPQRTYVNLELANAVALPYPTHRLEGTGKRLRHVKIRCSDDMHQPDIRALLEAAARAVSAHDA